MKMFVLKRKHLELQNLKLKLPQVNFAMYHNDCYYIVNIIAILIIASGGAS